MKTNSDIVREALEKSRNILQGLGHNADYIDEAITAFKTIDSDAINEMISLIDGAYEVVELFGYHARETAPSNVEWAKSWRGGARKFIPRAGVYNENV